METLRQPGQQTGLGAGQVDARHANLGESKFLAPGLYLRNHLTAINEQAGVLHRPIVKSLVWANEAQTQLFAAALARQVALRDSFVELRGELGAGKTTLVRHLLQALGVLGRIKSPTYAVVEPYELAHTPTDPRPLAIWHFDFYRFADPREWEDAGFRDIFSSPGLKLAEWPENAADFLPLADLVVHLEVHTDGSRRVRLVAQSPTGAALLAAPSA